MITFFGYILSWFVLGLFVLYVLSYLEWKILFKKSKDYEIETIMIIPMAMIWPISLVWFLFILNEDYGFLTIPKKFKLFKAKKD